MTPLLYVSDAGHRKLIYLLSRYFQIQFMNRFTFLWDIYIYYVVNIITYALLRDGFLIIYWGYRWEFGITHPYKLGERNRDSTTCRDVDYGLPRPLTSRFRRRLHGEGTQRRVQVQQGRR